LVGAEVAGDGVTGDFAGPGAVRAATHVGSVPVAVGVAAAACALDHAAG
jgi:hypothetical protein